MDAVTMWDVSCNSDGFANHYQRKESSGRACEGCARKKTKCHMQRPVCSLCSRIGTECVYPTRRKKTSRRRDQAQRRARSASKAAEDGLASTTSEVPFSIDTVSNPSDNPSQLDATWQAPVTTNPSVENQLEDRSEESRNPQPVLSEIDQSAGSDMFFGFSLSPFTSDHQFNAAFGDLGHAVDRNQSSTSEWPRPQEAYNFNHSLSHTGLVGTEPIPESHFEIDNFPDRTSWPSVSENGESTRTSAISDRQDLFSIDLPPDITDYMLELYFEKVQPSLPLLHRPRILAAFSRVGTASEQRYQQLDLETSLLLNGMFALAARFSERDDFWVSEPKLRGNRFAKKAQALFDLRSREEEDDHLTLKYLQGCILLTYYQLATRPSFQAWVNIGHCCRLAYALLIHQVDRFTGSLDPNVPLSGEEWSKKEERRRALWVIFQMDNFASVIGGRPFNIDMSRVDVWLPVSDEAWFNLRPIQSAPIPSKGPATAWETLMDSDNQDAYAWYLVCNYLLRSALEEFERRDRSVEGLRILQTAIQCFTLSLPQHLRMRAKNVDFREKSFRDENWIISTHFMILSASITVGLGFHSESLKRQEANSLNDDAADPWSSPVSSDQQCDKFLGDQLRVVRMWTSDFIPLATPFITAALVTPAAKYSVNAQLLESDSRDDVLSALDGKLLELVLKRFSEYWGIGSFCLDLLQALKTPKPTEAIRAKGLGVTWVQSVLQRAQFLKFKPGEVV